LITTLDEASEPLRWWAAQGCTLLGEKAAPAAAALRKRLDDPSGAVAVAAAEALARLGQTDAALPVLERWMQDATNPSFALQAANVLDRLGEQARPLLPAIRRVTQAPKGKKNAPPRPRSWNIRSAYSKEQPRHWFTLVYKEQNR